MRASETWYSVSVESFSEKGDVRSRNEDAVRVSLERAVFVLCDGVGGSGCGDFASTTVAQFVLDRMLIAGRLEGSHESDTLAAIVRDSNEHLKTLASTRGSNASCSTTLVAACLIEGHICVCNVGDSRAYHLGAKATRLTVDHTLAQRLLDSGVPRPTLPVDAHNTLWQSIGSGAFVQPCVRTVPTQSGDRFMLCSDGVYNALSEKKILALSMRHREAQAFTRALRGEVLASNPQDNASAIVFDLP
jgi:serine/threonine protein phosphatase PrpC